MFAYLSGVLIIEVQYKDILITHITKYKELGKKILKFFGNDMVGGIVAYLRAFTRHYFRTLRADTDTVIQEKWQTCHDPGRYIPNTSL
jgi:hypothetical protein